MSDELLTSAVSTVLATLQLVQDEYGVIHDVHQFDVEGTPTNLIQFSLNGSSFDLFVTEKSSRPSGQRHIDLSLREMKREIDDAQSRHPSTQRQFLAGPQVA